MPLPMPRTGTGGLDRPAAVELAAGDDGSAATAVGGGAGLVADAVLPDGAEVELAAPGVLPEPAHPAVSTHKATTAKPARRVMTGQTTDVKACSAAVASSSHGA